VFYAVVNFNSILLAFKEYKGVDDAYNEIYVWSFGNFARMFREFQSPNSDLLTGFLNTLKYFGINVVLMIPLSLFVAYFLYKKIAGYKAFRVVFFLPSIISAVVYVTIFKNIISTFGPVYTIVEKLFGYEMPPLLNTDGTATPTIIFYTVWTGLGINMILYQGAMNRLPAEIIEAGRMDGITWLRELWSVVIPIIWPTLSMTVIIAFTGLFNSGGPVLLFSEAGSILGRNKTMTLPFLIYTLTWYGKVYEYPAAIGVFFTLISLPIVLGIRKLMSKIDPEVEY
jgi:raffinose/stachyose/melibiose transport system permease protein